MRFFQKEGKISRENEMCFEYNETIINLIIIYVILVLYNKLNTCQNIFLQRMLNQFFSFLHNYYMYVIGIKLKKDKKVKRIDVH
jgi:hypothetical protein